MKNFHFLKIFKKGLFIGMLCFSILGVAQTPTEIYFSNFAAAMNDATHSVTAAGTCATGSFKTGAPTWATGQSGYFESTGSAGNTTVTFTPALTVASCGANAGTIVVKWGAGSNRPLNLTIGSGSAIKIDEVASSAERNIVRTATYTIPAGTTSIPSIKFSSSGGGQVFVFSVQVNSCLNIPSLILNPTSLSGFTYAENYGPSAEQSFSISGTNLTAGNITITAPTGYEVKTTGTFGSSATIAASAGTLAATTVYVRLAAGQTENTSITGDISVSGAGVTTAQKVALTGSVTGAPTLVFTPNPLPTLSYIEGQGPSATQTIYISGTNLPAGDINISPGNIHASLSASGPFAFVGLTIPGFSGGTLAPTPIYVQLPAGKPAGSYSASSYISASITGTSSIVYQTGNVFFTADVLPAPTTPTLLVNPTSLTGLDYVFGNGPSVPQSFSISGALLTAGAAITITALTNFEVSTSQLGTYAPTASIPNTAGGTLPATSVYVRLAAGKAINPYTGNITVTGGGAAATHTVGLTGAVTPAPLSIPTLGSPSAATETGFTAAWNSVANAVGYIINVYQNGTFVKAVNALQSETFKAIAGLQSSTTYTYKVIAVGNGVNYVNSAESLLSSPITTLMPSVVITSPCGNNMISRYHTDFSDWGTVSGGSSSGDYATIPSGGGAGFIIQGGVSVSSSGMISANSGRTAEFPSFNFINGGNVTFVVEVGSSNRNLILRPIESGMTWSLTPNGGTTTTGSGNSVALAKNATYTVTYTYPASFNGNKTLILEVPQTSTVKGITVCSNPGTTPIITTTPMPNVQQSMSAPIGGNTDMKVIQIKGFNLTGDVTLSVEGDYAGYFSLSTETMDMTSAMAGTNLGITYTSSSLSSIHDAKLKISSPGAADVYVPLMGVSLPITGTTPVILASDEPISFVASRINTQTLKLNVAGVNLTGDITATISGIDKNFFSPQIQTITKLNATGGTTISITYTGDIYVNIHEALLTLSSPGAQDVRINLFGETTEFRPEMYSIRFMVSPSGSGIIKQSLAGTSFKKGTVLTVTATPEPGYKLVRWNDGLGGTSLVRNFTMNSDKGTIIVYFEKGTTSPPPPTNGDFNVYPPTNIAQTSMNISWDAVTGANSYIVTVYDEDGNVVGSPLAGFTITNTILSGLTPNTLYKYGVTAVMPNPIDNKTTLIIGPFRTLQVANPTYNCGQ